MLYHLLTLSTFIIPLGSVLDPLIMWLIKKDQSSFVFFNGKESLNLQISILIYSIVSSALMLVFIGFILIIIVLIFWLVMVIIASMKATEGIVYQYPLTIRFVK
ncbi:hypothetical protein L3i20_v214020 [Paenibacillus sp. L3-i20]|nr:hypothetical protein L3i20_v214020 [Paenibacillus sp. L3-i20]